MKDCCTPIYRWFVKPHCKSHGLVIQFFKWKMKLRHVSRSGKEPGNTVFSIPALRPMAHKPGSTDYRLRWINIFRAISLLYSAFLFFTSASHYTSRLFSFFVSKAKEPFNLFAFQPLAANFALRLVWIENPTSRIANPKYSSHNTSP